MEIGWARVREPPRVGTCKIQHRSHAAGRRGHPFAVGKKGQLRHAPGGFQPFHRLRKIDPRSGFAQHIHIFEARQAFGKRAKQQRLALHREKVLAVDPHQIYRAVGLARCLFGTHPLDDFGGIRNLHVFQRYAETALNLAGRPLQVGIDAFTASPGVEVHGLAARPGLDGAPGGAGLGPSGNSERTGDSADHLAARQGVGETMGHNRIAHRMLSVG